MRPKISSPHSGRIGYWFGSGSVAARTAATALMGTPWLARRCGSAEDEREGETEDGQRLGEGEAEEGDRLEQAAGLGLTGDAVDVGREDEADADAGADGREAVAEDRDVSGHGDSFPFLGPSLPAVPVRVAGPGAAGAARGCRAALQVVPVCVSCSLRCSRPCSPGRQCSSASEPAMYRA